MVKTAILWFFVTVAACFINAALFEGASVGAGVIGGFLLGFLIHVPFSFLYYRWIMEDEY